MCHDGQRSTSAALHCCVAAPKGLRDSHDGTCSFSLANMQLQGICIILPSGEFDLTTNSQEAHIKTHSGLILRSLSYLTVNSQYDSHCELAVSMLWAFREFCNSHRGLAVSYSWDYPMNSLWVGLLLAHCDLTVIPHSEIFRWAHCEYGVSSHLHWAIFSSVKDWRLHKPSPRSNQVMSDT